MGVIIYPIMELTSDVKLSEHQKRQIEFIKDGWDQQAFKCKEGDEITLASESMEGSSPDEYGVLNPLNRLLSYAKRQGFRLDGQIEIHSDWNDYDNVLIQVTNNEFDSKNLEIANASTRELLDELIKRKVLTHEEAETFLSRDTEFERD